MNKKKNIKYIMYWSAFLLIFIGLSFALFGIPKGFGMYIAIYLALFILASVIIYFYNFESVKKEEWEPTIRIKQIASNKFGWFVILLLFILVGIIFSSIAFNLSFLTLFGIFAILFLIIFYLAYLIYKFFAKKGPIVPLLLTGINVFEQKPFQYFYIICIIITFIVVLIFTIALFMNLFFGWTI